MPSAEGLAPAQRLKLTLFDLDHTLIGGDSDVLWCSFLLQQGVLDRATFEPRNRALEAAYRAGSVGAREFCDFYVSTLAGRTAADWETLRQRFLHDQIAPRAPAAAHALVQRHQRAGDLIVMTTATNRLITEPTAALFGIEHLIATECEVGADGRLTGRSAGTLNMREGKVQRLHAWLAARGLTLAGCDSTAYSDSINDLPLLGAVDHAVMVNPDARLAAEGARRGWPTLDLHG
jgi:HAD superfamily hydrolase (TIGR01490 family)